MKNEIEVYIRVDEGGTLPTYESEYAAGCDLYATKNMILRPGEKKIMPLNFVLAIPAEIEAQVRPRSGLSLKTDLKVSNSPGTVDADYKDIVGVILHNNYNIANLPYEILYNPELLSSLKEDYQKISLEEYLLKSKPQTILLDDIFSMEILKETVYIDKNGQPYGTIYINKGERIAQMVFNEYKQAKFIPHLHPEKIGKNRGGGYGHSGV